MVIVHLKGGLGNQMFQYAAGRALALRRGEPLLLNTHSFPLYDGRSYVLDRYCTVGELAPARAVRRLTRQGYGRYTDALLRKAERLLGKPPAVVRERRPFQYDPQLFADLPTDVYLEGYWQNERYFQDISGTIRRELTLRALPEGKNAQLLAAIEGCTAVSLHVRRGDYVVNKAALAFHGVCSPDYYRRAIETIAQHIVSPHFFVFSDDIAWVKENLAIPQSVTFVAHNGPAAAHEDLRLLQACKHHIIANSTFSWWGAWLSEWPDKLVIAPRRWLNDLRHDTSDLIPAGWLRLDGGGAA